MYPWFHPYHPGYPPPPPRTTGPTVFAEAANGAAAGAGQHHVYVHGMKGYGRGWGYRRGPSRLKWVSRSEFRYVPGPRLMRISLVL